MKAEHPPVTHIVTRLNVGGAARQIRLLHPGLPERGFEPFVVSGRKGAREGRLAVEGPERDRDPLLVREMRPDDKERAFRAIARLLRSNDRVAGLLDRPEEASAFGQAAKAPVAERLAAARTVEAHVELYRELLERRRR